jgi:hypothetical protein
LSPRLLRRPLRRLRRPWRLRRLWRLLPRRWRVVVKLVARQRSVVNRGRQAVVL